MRLKSSVSPTKKLLLFIGVVGLLAASAGFLLVYYGVYNVSALTGHTAPVYKILEYARIRAVEVRALQSAPPLDALDWRGKGAQIYELHCLQCHGGPGVSPEPFALGMMPPPSAIVRVAKTRSPEELYWVTKHGIKMSGMPAWKYRLTENELWQVVAFLKKIPQLTAAEYAQVRGDTAQAHTSAHKPEPNAWPEGYDGKVALQQYNCTSCHYIDGIPSASHYVGPPLSNMVKRSFIAGILPTTRENLIRWIIEPQKFKAQTTMPDLGVSREHAEIMVDYLEEIARRD